jgi:hypothetical protein
MHWRIWQTGIAPRRTYWLCSAFGLWVLAAGCSKSHPRSVEHVEVTGKVLFQGKPLPGGQITFLTPIGGFANTGPIDENGIYHISAPVGPVQIGVDNRALQPQTQELDKRLSKIRGRPIESLELKGLKGRYVAIPPKYYRVDTSGLTYEVKPEPQTYDIVLDDK